MRTRQTRTADLKSFFFNNLLSNISEAESTVQFESDSFASCYQVINTKQGGPGQPAWTPADHSQPEVTSVTTMAQGNQETNQANLNAA